MIFKGLQENNGWMIAEYSATWRYGYDFMLDAAQTVIDTDFQDNLQRVAVASLAGANNIEKLDEVAAAGKALRNCPSFQKEQGVLAVSGVSKMMECPVQLMFFNQTDLVRLLSPGKEYFQKHGEHVFDNYMNSIEIVAYCRAAERRAREN